MGKSIRFKYMLIIRELERSSISKPTCFYIRKKFDSITSIAYEKYLKKEAFINPDSSIYWEFYRNEERVINYKMANTLRIMIIKDFAKKYHNLDL